MLSLPPLGPVTYPCGTRSKSPGCPPACTCAPPATLRGARASQCRSAAARPPGRRLAAASSGRAHASSRAASGWPGARRPTRVARAAANRARPRRGKAAGARPRRSRTRCTRCRACRGPRAAAA
eukprot:1541071-Prymnesium_polylepis.1